MHTLSLPPSLCPSLTIRNTKTQWDVLICSDEFHQVANQWQDYLNKYSNVHMERVCVRARENKQCFDVVFFKSVCCDIKPMPLAMLP
jgi:hypothetical protein